jgi:hypothetical protein
MAFKKRYIGLALAIFAAVGLTQFPAKWAATLAGVDLPVTLGGTVWNGYAPSINAVPPIQFKTSPSGFFNESSLLTFTGAGNGVSINGRADYNKIEEINVTGDASFLGQIDGRLSNLSGRFDMKARELKIDGGCDGASGVISTDILARNTRLWQWTGPPLSGPITCEQGVLTSILSGQIPGQSVEAVLKILPDGTYQIRAVINTNTPQAGVVLPLYGFEAQGERFTMNEAGRWM